MISTGLLWLGGYLLVTVALAVLAYVYWEYRAASGATFLFAGALLGGVGTLCYLLSLVAPALAVKVLLVQLVTVLGAGVVACWYLFTLTWTGRDALLSGPAVALALAPLVAGTVLLVTNGSPAFDGYHTLVWQSVAADGTGVVTPLTVRPGPLALLVDGYSALLTVASASLLVAYARRNEQRLYRWQNAVLVAGAVAALLFGVGFALVDTGYRPHPFAALVGHAFVVAGIVRFGDYDVVSLPENSLIEAIDAGVLVYGVDGRVVDLNEAAERVLGLSSSVVGEGIVGVVELADPFPGVRTDGAGTGVPGASNDPAAVADRLDGHEFTTTLGGDPHTFLVRVSELVDDGEPLGWTVLCYDVTGIRRKQGELDLLKQVLSRVLRHNVRNDLSVVRTNAERLLDGTDGLEAERARTIVAKSEDLLDASEKARAVEKLVGSGRERRDTDLVTVVREAIDTVEPAFPGVTFRTSLPDRCEVRAHPALSAAVENLVENGAVHNDDADPTVVVGVDCDAETATLTVADDGPGIPYGELAVLDRGEETQLEHGSSVGLWLVDWIVDLSGADIDFENTDRGCTVTLTLDRATGEDEDAGIVAELDLGIDD